MSMRTLLTGRRRLAAAGRERLSPATYIELVQSLFEYTVPALIMTLCFVCTGAYLALLSNDPVLLLLYAIGLLASSMRLLALFGFRRRVFDPGLGLNVARSIERRFGYGYIAFAAALGLFGGWGYATVDIDQHLLIVALVFGYAAGVAATVPLRLWISLTASVLAVVPTIIAALLTPGVAHWGTGLLMALFLAGGLLSMIKRYRGAAAQISMRHLMETLARQDDLTGLPNRLVLRERFDQIVGRSDDSDLIAVHCVDINQLEPVNETYGHRAGDALLKAVAQRLRRVVRGDNLVIHLNGDDFVVIQPNMADGREAELLAQQIVSTLDKSYAVAGEDIIITANIGYAVDLQESADLERLLASAERALRQGKRGATGISAYDPSIAGHSLPA
ncbi:diguanylate cyclase domain-containing protein [Rhizorhabdus sp.]|jgi:diguanylate cyclase (GGDEF)-like protein|uniref:diguanylate cyclase domain-containing protein n=1 Tax=Rhizorhabdus sp. TaxID=1968843 RepID=UPI0035B19DC8